MAVMLLMRPDPDVFREPTTSPARRVGRDAARRRCWLAMVFPCRTCAMASTRSWTSTLRSVVIGRAKAVPGVKEGAEDETRLVFERHEALDALDEPEAGGDVEAPPVSPSDAARGEQRKNSHLGIVLPQILLGLVHVRGEEQMQGVRDAGDVALEVLLR